MKLEPRFTNPNIFHRNKIRNSEKHILFHAFFYFEGKWLSYQSNYSDVLSRLICVHDIENDGE